MALEDYKNDMEGCSRCSSCKWIPFNQVKSWRFAHNCPAISRYNLHAYSGSGKMIMGLSMLTGRSELNESIMDIIFTCQLCGACDTACKVYRDDIDLMDVLLELRTHCVEEGELVIEHMATIDALKRENNMLGEKKEARGDWAEGLPVKDINQETVDVLFHAGCRYSYDPDSREALRGIVKLLVDSGVDVGIAGASETCCGGRAYKFGYRGEAENYADDMLSRVKSSGASLLVTPCADGYSAFNYLYPRMKKELPVEVLHITQYLERLLKNGVINLKDSVPRKVTYHDPCYLGRMGEPYLGDWQDSKLLRPMSMKRAGRNGVYDTPRNIIKQIPALELVEMERIKEYSWCCGAGGGVWEAYPDFAVWTASERIEEALSTGADTLVTSCPWCLRVFREALAEQEKDLRIMDINELVLESAGICSPATLKGGGAL